MGGSSFLRKVKFVVIKRHLLRATAPVAAPEQIDAQLDACFDQLLELTAPGLTVADLDEAVAHACARAEEWTA
jgi:hypothetical protein